MSALDGLKERLKNSFSSIASRVKESAVYASLQDRYESLNPQQQKLALGAGTVVLLFLILFYPITLFLSSSDHISQYEAKRELIRDMFRAYRESSALPNVATPPVGEGLKSAIQSILSQAHLLPEQILGVSESFPDGNLMPATLAASAYEVKLSKLNLKQIVDIGSALVGISESTKMKDMSVIANSSDARYFDVNYKLISLNVPIGDVPAMNEPEPTGNRKNNAGH